MFAEDAYHRGGNGDELIRTQQQAAIGRKLLVPRDAAQQHAKVHARRHTPAFTDPHSNEADVIGIGQRRDGAAVIEGDVELARQPEHVTRV